MDSGMDTAALTVQRLHEHLRARDVEAELDGETIVSDYDDLVLRWRLSTDLECVIDWMIGARGPTAWYLCHKAANLISLQVPFLNAVTQRVDHTHGSGKAEGLPERSSIRAYFSTPVERGVSDDQVGWIIDTLITMMNALYDDHLVQLSDIFSDIGIDVDELSTDRIGSIEDNRRNDSAAAVGRSGQHPEEHPGISTSAQTVTFERVLQHLESRGIPFTIEEPEEDSDGAQFAEVTHDGVAMSLVADNGMLTLGCIDFDHIQPHANIPYMTAWTDERVRSHLYPEVGVFTLPGSEKCCLSTSMRHLIDWELTDGQLDVLLDRAITSTCAAVNDFAADFASDFTDSN